MPEWYYLNEEEFDLMHSFRGFLGELTPLL
jgi:hypothetical protein